MSTTLLRIIEFGGDATVTYQFQKGPWWVEIERQATIGTLVTSKMYPQYDCGYRVGKKTSNSEKNSD